MENASILNFFQGAFEVTDLRWQRKPKTEDFQTKTAAFRIKDLSFIGFDSLLGDNHSLCERLKSPLSNISRTPLPKGVLDLASSGTPLKSVSCKRDSRLLLEIQAFGGRRRQQKTAADAPLLLEIQASGGRRKLQIGLLVAPSTGECYTISASAPRPL